MWNYYSISNNRACVLEQKTHHFIPLLLKALNWLSTISFKQYQIVLICEPLCTIITYLDTLEYILHVSDVMHSDFSSFASGESGWLYIR